MPARALPAALTVAIAKATPPHRDLAGYLETVRRMRPDDEPAGTRAEQTAARIRMATAPMEYMRIELRLARGLHFFEAAEIERVHALLVDAWHPPGPAQARILERVKALGEVAGLRDRGRVGKDAALRLVWMVDLGRGADPPDDPATTFGKPEGPVGLLAARAVVEAEAPAFWRLAGADFVRCAARLEGA